MGSSATKRKPIIIGTGFSTAAVIVFALISVFVTSHHVNEAKRYNEQYKKANLAVMFRVTTVLNGTPSEGLSYVALNRNNALNEIEQSREAVNYFAKIHWQWQMSSEISYVRDSTDNELAYLDAVEKLFRAETESQLKDEISAVKLSGSDKFSEYGFQKSLERFIKRLHELDDPQNRQPGDIFVWL